MCTTSFIISFADDYKKVYPYTIVSLIYYLGVSLSAKTDFPAKYAHRRATSTCLSG